MKLPKKPEQWLTITEVAAILHIHQQTVREMCRRGEFTRTFKFRGKYWRIAADDVARWQEAQQWAA
ncbi:helix-turn-helix domain-containing protein [Tsukamurella tyrosinosolvens]|uniref:helix-turn-helix domain-containing protein n=1 Tax=Tsukamurella tyrosinosolvens TaxID=57704 RepID=UPI002DD44504|nr:helix-turn-helix domain-containing protein [Tsukamurella tyrosinosolvens]MEC4616306.1 helix-turn-helix domain-containing protein [Tsukamurella tyrosinosolvens]